MSKSFAKKTTKTQCCFLSLDFCIALILAFLGEGSSKTLLKGCRENILPRHFFGLALCCAFLFLGAAQKALFVLFYRVLGCFSARGVQKHHVKKQRPCRKAPTKKIRQNIPIASRLLLAFFGEGSI
jgi:hypothetical protein